ncbi:MAG: IS256 family transposase [Parachlamydiaceae bacterium]
MLVPMSIIKLEIRLSEITKALEAFKISRKKALESLSTELRRAVSSSLNELMQAEIDVFLGEPGQSENKRNGYHPEREYILKGIGGVRVRLPRDRKGQFESSIIPSHERIDPRLRADMAVIHLAGLSTRTLSMISQRLLGVGVSKDTISSSLGILSSEARNWLERPIKGKYWALYVDGTNFKLQRRGSTKREPSLVVLGVDENNLRSILAIEPGTKDDVSSWRSVFSSLKRRGLDASAVRLGIMDGLPGLEKLFKDEFPNSSTQRCWVHALCNATAKTPARLREEFVKLAHKIMYADSEDAARQALAELKAAMNKEAQRAVHCIEKDLVSLLTFYRFDRELWGALRTTNPIETINRQFKRRTKSMDTLGEETLETVLAFVALKIEIGWRNHPINSKVFSKNKKKFSSLNTIEMAVDEIGLLH